MTETRSGRVDRNMEQISRALDVFAIELPSWGFANTGTRFGKFAQAAAATNIEEKFADAGEVNRLTGVSPTVALHVLWDLPSGTADVPEIQALERKHGVRAGSINPNLFQAAGVQVRVDREPECGDSGQCAGASAGFGGDRARAGVDGCLALDCGWVELSGHAEYAQAHRVDGRGAGEDACGAGRGPADADRVQAV